MKRIRSIMLLLGVFAVFSCTKTQTADGGQVSFSVLSDCDVVEVTKSQVSDYTKLPTAGDFTIKVTDASGASVYSGKISGWDASTRLSTGNYSVTAEYGALDEEGFDKPYFYGSSNFAIIGGSTTNVSVPVISPLSAFCRNPSESLSLKASIWFIKLIEVLSGISSITAAIV